MEAARSFTVKLTEKFPSIIVFVVFVVMPGNLW
jgi:hypothetical protein